MKELLLSATMVAALVLPASAQVEPLPDSILGGWCFLPVGSTGTMGNILLYQREESQDECHTSWLHFTKDGYYGQDGNRGGPGCLNRFSASISGASARVRLPSGVAAG
jgi:hypothetical protein